MKSIGGRLRRHKKQNETKRRQKKAEQEEIPRTGLKAKRSHFLYIGGCRIVND